MGQTIRFVPPTILRTLPNNVLDRHGVQDWGFAMKTLTTTAMTLALLTVPAYSQGKGSAPDPKADAEVVEQKKRAEEIERDYKASVNRTKPKATEAPSDPWQTVRPSSPAKPKQ